MKFNIVTATDSYKFSHAQQYPPGTERVFSYFESRTGATYPETVFFGLQAILKEYFLTRVTRENVEDAALLVSDHIGPNSFNAAGWMHIVNDHGGKLPIRIRAVPEGTVVPTGNVMMTVENTCPKCWWVTNYFETLLVQTWYPSTVATQSRAMKAMLRRYLAETADNLDGLPFKLHDFGYRGVSSVETAGLGGMAHLVNFTGTDTVRGIEYAMAFYPTLAADGKPVMPGFSIPASEHSTITSWGAEGELDAMRNMLEQYPTGIVACVSDSWDIYKACHKWGGELRDAVLARDGVLVVRPDSGDPIDVVPKVLDILSQKFGYTTNEKGYKVLDPHVRMIQGDGIDAESLGRILEAVKVAGYSTDNIAFGSGGGLLQKLNRDTQRFAFKCSAVNVKGEWRDVFKRPATDAGKNSKAGRLELYRYPDGTYETSVEDLFAMRGKAESVLETVFENGELLVDHTFDEVRARAELPAVEEMAVA